MTALNDIKQTVISCFFRLIRNVSDESIKGVFCLKYRRK